MTVITDEERRRLFDVFMDQSADFWGLGCVLDSVMKDRPVDWMQFVHDYMIAMDLHNSGLFPSEWFPEDAQ